jgi:flagellar protein FlbD
MITLTRLGHESEQFQLNPDMIVTVESTPDTVITLATGIKVVVAQSPADVAQAVHEFRASVLAEAFRRRGSPARAPSPVGVHRDSTHLSAVASTPEGDRSG